MKYQTRVRKFAKEARARLLKNEYEKPEIKTPSNRVFKMAKDPQEDKLYDLVCKIASSDEIVTDPIKRLMDNHVFECMDENSKSKYVFTISNKYISLLERRRHEALQQNLQYASVLD